MLQDRSYVRPKKSLNKFKKIEVISSIFSNHSGIKPENTYKNKTGKFTNIWRLNNILLNSQWVKKEFKRDIKKDLETNENGITTYQNLWDATKVAQRANL